MLGLGIIFYAWTRKINLVAEAYSHIWHMYCSVIASCSAYFPEERNLDFWFSLI